MWVCQDHSRLYYIFNIIGVWSIFQKSMLWYRYDWFGMKIDMNIEHVLMLQITLVDVIVSLCLYNSFSPFLKIGRRYDNFYNFENWPDSRDLFNEVKKVRDYFCTERAMPWKFSYKIKNLLFQFIYLFNKNNLLVYYFFLSRVCKSWTIANVL